MKIKVICTHCGRKQTHTIVPYTMDYELTCKFCGKDGECRELQTKINKELQAMAEKEVGK